MNAINKFDVATEASLMGIVPDCNADHVVQLPGDLQTIVKLGIRIQMRKSNDEVKKQLHTLGEMLKHGYTVKSHLAAACVSAARPKLSTPKMRWVAKNLIETVHP